MEEKRLRIVFLCRDFKKVNRGVEAYVRELSQRLEKKFDIEIFYGKDADSLGKVINGNFNLVIPTNGRIQALKISLGRIMKDYKVLIAAHAGIGRDEILNLLTLPDAYVVLTESELNWSKKFPLNTKLVKISNGINLEKFQKIGKKIAYGLSGQVVLSVGALEWYKHHDLAIQAVSKLENTSLLIVGSGPDKEKLEKLGKGLLDENNFKIISANYEDMPAIYRGADIFTLPSWEREAFGIVYLEAMATGLGIVAPNDLSRKEIIGDAGILVDVFNTEAYTNAIDKALKRNWGNLPRSQAEKFSWNKIASQYEKLILEICR